MLLDIFSLFLVLVQCVLIKMISLSKNYLLYSEWIPYTKFHNIFEDMVTMPNKPYLQLVPIYKRYEKVKINRRISTCRERKMFVNVELEL